MTGRLPVEEVTLQVSCGELPAKAVVGESVPTSARSYREGHEALGCNVSWIELQGNPRPSARMKPGAPGLDLWYATIQPDTPGMWTFSLKAFNDPYLTWRHAVTRKIEAGQGEADLANELAGGAALLEQAAEIVPAKWQGGCSARHRRCATATARCSPGSAALSTWPTCCGTTRCGSWSRHSRSARSRWAGSAHFSLPGTRFSRSEGAAPGVHGTFATAARCLPEVAQMGFDVLYLISIHPIGRVNRKGRNNSLVAAPVDVGSP